MTGIIAQTPPPPAQQEERVVTTKWDYKQISEAFGYFIGGELTSPDSSYKIDEVIRGMRIAEAGEPDPGFSDPSVARGYLWAKGFAGPESPINVDDVIRGIRMAQRGDDPPMTAEEFGEAVRNLGPSIHPTNEQQQEPTND